MKYHIASAETVQGLNRIINARLVAGWVCSGGIAAVYYPPNGVIYFYQSMTKKPSTKYRK
jgi:hypothetical protein